MFLQGGAGDDADDAADVTVVGVCRSDMRCIASVSVEGRQAMVRG
jgi:hypothetical protein